MLPSFSVASIKREAALAAKAGRLGEGESGLSRRVIAREKPASIAGRGTNFRE
jgi:hypothetical protein